MKDMHITCRHSRVRHGSVKQSQGPQQLTVIGATVVMLAQRTQQHACVRAAQQVAEAGIVTWAWVSKYGHHGKVC